MNMSPSITISSPEPVKEVTATTILKTKAAKKAKTNQILSAVKPITCYEDLIKLPEIPTKLNNLKLPKKERVGAGTGAPMSLITASDMIPTRTPPQERLPGRYIPSDFDVIVDASTFTTAHISKFFKQVVQQLGPLFFVDRASAITRVRTEIRQAGGLFLKPTSTHWIKCDAHDSERFTQECFERLFLRRGDTRVEKQPPARTPVQAKIQRVKQPHLSSSTKQLRQVSIEGRNALDLLSEVALSTELGQMATKPRPMGLPGSGASAPNQRNNSSSSRQTNLSDDYYNSVGLKSMQ